MSETALEMASRLRAKKTLNQLQIEVSEERQKITDLMAALAASIAKYEALVILREQAGWHAMKEAEVNDRTNVRKR